MAQTSLSRRLGLRLERGTVHELKRAAHAERSEAKNAVDATETRRRQRIHTLERQLAEIRSPSDPLLRPRLGELALHRSPTDAVQVPARTVDEAEFLEKREADEARLKEELELARGDTSDQDAARERLSQVTLEQQQDPRPEHARRELEAARDRWQALTGRRPPG
ncbi:hypothetical protein [Streptomyces caeruleatus]|uniref:hypothetical protein n=1 Tax=Streptomyces caeruleatus TaxID=661399 RepID=UPI00131C9826|nr:hypothetical protein [Streptomyces caeruleatus]